MPPRLWKVGAANLEDAVADLIPYLAVTVVDLTGLSGTATIQAKDAAGNNLAGRFLVRTWIAEAAYSEPDSQSTFGVDTGEEMVEIEAGADLEVISDANGAIGITIEVAGARTVYVMAEIDGRVYMGSVAITV